ncbi:hypothetical protein PVAP13_8KG146400 [Panicum virgatum]|uniref:PB1 domain-containing protein n=1 Tax=Panicum virgatum TaxID=38727 RepID=A0A8T0PVH4_PANVG|nr:hypothetical protein PVAP13_8KG146400 [Panicum virgatum]
MATTSSPLLRLSRSKCSDRPCPQSPVQTQRWVVMVSPGDSVLAATKKMVEVHASSAVVAVGNKAQGILTSRDILMRVIAKNLSSDSTPVEKVMTPDPECATVDMPILDALRTMQERKFLHLPVMDRGASSQKNVHCNLQMMSEAHHESVAGSEAAYPSVFSFKLQDRRGRMHRFSCEVQSLTPLVTSILQRLGADIDPDRLPQILYEDEDGDKVVLASDDYLAAAVDHARLAGWKGLRLFLDYSGTTRRRKAVASSSGGAMAVGLSSRDAWAAAYSGVAAGAALVTGIGVMAYLRRSG